jgi:DNA-binding CsgD family transcriptional regulator
LSTRVPQEGIVALLHALGTREQGFAFFCRDNRILHATPALEAMLDDPAFDGLEEECRRFAKVLWGSANVRHLHAEIEPLGAHSVRRTWGECRLAGVYVGADLFGDGPSVLVGVYFYHDTGLSPERVRQRFGLTRKQSRVALLLVEGLRNDEIARRLYISPHTARHHVEQVKLKVGGHTRAAVAARILQSDT